MRHVLVFLLLTLAGCTAPTLQQRQDNWRRHMTVQQATCAVGQGDPAMPDDVRAWCSRVAAP